MSIFRRKRLWSTGREGVYRVSVDRSAGKDSRRRKGSHDSDTSDAGISISSACSLASFEASDDAKKHLMSRGSSVDDNSSMFEVYGTGLNGSLEWSDDEEVWDSISEQERSVRLLSSHKKMSLVPLQPEIQDEINQEKASPEKNIEKAADRHVDPIDEDTTAHMQDVVAAIMEQYSKDNDSDSDSSTAVSENSEVDLNVSSDEESDLADEKEEVFDYYAHIKKICKREDGSDSESDGNESATSEKVFQNAVRKAMKKIKRERSDELAESDTASPKASEKGSESERSPNSDDSSSESSDDEESDSSSVESETGSFEMTRDVDPEIQELMEGGLVIDPKKGRSDADDSHTVYRYYMNNEGRVDSVTETVDKPSEEPENPPTANTQENNTASTLDDSIKPQDLRWPFSNFYVKEISQETPFPENCEALPSYRSTQASASHPGRKRNVMLGRVWWVEWWAKEDTKMKSSTDDTS
ncbi:hypothetical protein OS493_021040 [Desmophyllum pertusum]|uniref:Uncharacterized protein n=1 Tax=Desmophyllum pertusum TaxID=174260 RepID=A0A9X0D8S5_9CNID|nr:hypothetical protein OS493_021040 [Desmophyllum pertusum]